MGKKIQLDSAYLTLDNNGEMHLVVRDEALPDGFRAAIRNSHNYSTAMSHFQEKYPDLPDWDSLPKRVALPVNVALTGTINFGVTYSGKSMGYNPLHGIPHLKIVGRAGAGKTVAARAIAKSASEQGYAVLVMTPFPSDFESLPVTVYESSEWEEFNAVLTYDNFESWGKRYIIVDGVERNEEMEALLHFLFRIGRSYQQYVVLTEQEESELGSNNSGLIKLVGTIPGRAMMDDSVFQFGLVDMEEGQEPVRFLTL